MTSKRTKSGKARRPDPFLALRGDLYRKETDAIGKLKLGPSRDVLLRAAYVEISLAIVEYGSPSADDETTMARRTRMSPRLWRSAAADLERAGLLTRTPAGAWTTPMAESELERRALVQERADGGSRATHAQPKREYSQNDCENNGRQVPFPTPIPEPESVTSILPSTPRARGPDAWEIGGAAAVIKLPQAELGRGGVVSANARLKVATRLSIGNADPLVALYEAWPVSRTAQDADGLFIKVAPRLYRDATPEVRQACQPVDQVSSEPVGDDLRDEIANRQPRPVASGNDWLANERRIEDRRRRS